MSLSARQFLPPAPLPKLTVSNRRPLSVTSSFLLQLSSLALPQDSSLIQSLEFLHLSNSNSTSSFANRYHHQPSMDRYGPRPRGGPPGKHGDGSNKLSDIEDSVFLRKKSLSRQRQVMDQEDRDFGGHWEDCRDVDPYDPSGDKSDLETLKMQRFVLMQKKNALNDSGIPKQDALRGGFEYKMERINEDIARIEHATREGGKDSRGTGAPSYSMDSYPRQIRAGARKPQNINEVLFYSERNPLDESDLPRLKRDLAKMINNLTDDIEGGDDTGFSMAKHSIAKLTKDIAILESGQGPSVRKPQNINEVLFYSERNPLDIHDLSRLKRDHAKMLDILGEDIRDRNEGGCRITEASIAKINEDIAMLEMEQSQKGNRTRAKGAATRHRDTEGSSDDESDYYPFGPRHRGFVAGHGRYSGRQ